MKKKSAAHARQRTAEAMGVPQTSAKTERALTQAALEGAGETGGPGWYRMKARLGEAGMEEMRQQVLREQEEALGRVSPEALQQQEKAKEYPPRQPRKRAEEDSTPVPEIKKPDAKSAKRVKHLKKLVKAAKPGKRK